MTENFVYQSQAVRVLFGRGKLASVPAELDLHKRSRALILCTTSSRPTAERVQSEAAGRIADIHQLPKTGDARERLAKLIEHAQQKDADSLVVIGGGSPIGFAKTMAAKTGLRSVAVVTTYSGSEMASSWSIGAGPDRMAGDDDNCLPLTAIYDPDLTLSLPPRTSAASGMNAMAHAVETLYGPDINPVVEGLAAKAVELLGSSLPRVVDRPDDIDARTGGAVRRLARRRFPRAGRRRACAGAAGAAGVRARPFALPCDLHALFHCVQRQGRAARDGADRPRARRQGRRPGSLRPLCADRIADRPERPRHEGSRHPEGGGGRRRRQVRQSAAGVA